MKDLKSTTKIAPYRSYLGRNLIISFQAISFYHRKMKMEKYNFNIVMY